MLNAIIDYFFLKKGKCNVLNQSNQKLRTPININIKFIVTLFLGIRVRL